MNKEMTLLIYLRRGNSHKNTLRTELFPTLKSNPDLRIVIVSPMGNQPSLRSEFSSDRVVVEELPKTHRSFLENRLRNLRTYLWLSRDPPETFRIRREKRKHEGLRGRLEVFWQDSLAAAMSRARVTETKIRDWEVRLFHRREIARLFDRYQPNAVLFTNLHSANIHMLREARKRNVKGICFVQGWDNPTSKGPFSITPDHVLVWNENMRREIVQYHDLPSEKVDVVGSPQFDFYHDRSKFRSREAFFERYGLDPKLKLIAYCVAGGNIARSEPEVIDLFYRAMMDGRVKFPAQLLIRLHPGTRGDYLRQFDRFKGLLRLVVQPAGRVAKIKDGWDISQDDIIRLAETMLHSDVVVNVASTISLDAIAFDTPVIGIGFEGSVPRDYFNSYRRYYDFTHFNPVVKNGGIRVVSSLDQLIDTVNLYLENPSLDAAGRERVRRDQIYALDGKSAKRAGEATLRILGLAADTRKLVKPS